MFKAGAAAHNRESVGSRLVIGRNLLMPVPAAGIATMTRPLEMVTSYLWRSERRRRGRGVGGGDLMRPSMEGASRTLPGAHSVSNTQTQPIQRLHLRGCGVRCMSCLLK